MDADYTGLTNTITGQVDAQMQFYRAGTNTN